MRGVDEKYEWARFRLPGRWLMVATIALVALLGMTRFDMITSVEYVRSTATYVAHVPGKDWNHRIVVVHLEGQGSRAAHQRPLDRCAPRPNRMCAPVAIPGPELDPVQPGA